MNIKGVLEMEGGPNLHIDIEAPDDQEHIFVTNIHPNCLVIPKERWWVGYLALSPGVLRELRSKAIEHLDQLVDSSWELTVDGLSERARKEIIEALAHFQEIALVFKEPSREELGKEVVSFPLEKIQAKAELAVSPPIGEEVKLKPRHVSPDTSLEALMMPLHITTILKVRYEVVTISDVLRLGKRRLVMTPGLSAEDIRKLEIIFERAGHPLESSASEGEAGPTAEHLTEQGLKPAL